MGPLLLDGSEIAADSLGRMVYAVAGVDHHRIVLEALLQARQCWVLGAAAVWPLSSSNKEWT